MQNKAEYMCLLPSSQIMHSSMEQQLLPEVQYANYQSFERIDMHKTIEHCLLPRVVVWGVVQKCTFRNQIL